MPVLDANNLMLAYNVLWRSFAALTLAYLGFSIITTIYSAIYNLYFHPLRKFVGPKSWIAFPFLKNLAALRGQMDWKIKSFHDHYGEVIRYGPDELSFTSAQAWKDIYGHGHAELPKYFPKGLDFAKEPNIITANASDHPRFRRAMLPAFSDKALSQQEPLMRVYIDLLIEKLKPLASSHEPTNIVQWYMLTTFDLIGDLAYGQSFDGLKSNKTSVWMRNISQINKLFPILILVTSYPLVAALMWLITPPSIKNSRKQHVQMSIDLCMNRINSKTQKDRGDFMDYMMRARGQDHGLTDIELSYNTEILIIAGSETTATLLSGVTYYLLKYPLVYDKCVKEVRSAFNNDKDITFKEASARLPYMLACLDEALRLFPPVPTGTGRMTQRPTPIDGKMIPADTRVFTHQLSGFHSEKNFHKASEFVPERWLPETQTNPDSPYFNDNRDARQPFNVGPRNCVGRNLAYHEMRLILAKVLFNYDLTLCEDCEQWAETQRTFSLWEKPPLMVKLSERQIVDQ